MTVLKRTIFVLTHPLLVRLDHVWNSTQDFYHGTKIFLILLGVKLSLLLHKMCCKFQHSVRREQQPVTSLAADCLNFPKKSNTPCFCTAAVDERDTCKSVKWCSIFTSEIQHFYSSSSSFKQFTFGLYHLRRPLKSMVWPNLAKFWKLP